MGLNRGDLLRGSVNGVSRIADRWWVVKVEVAVGRVTNALYLADTHFMLNSRRQQRTANCDDDAGVVRFMVTGGLFQWVMLIFRCWVKHTFLLVLTTVSTSVGVA